MILKDPAQVILYLVRDLYMKTQQERDHKIEQKNSKGRITIITEIFTSILFSEK